MFILLYNCIIVDADVVTFVEICHVEFRYPFREGKQLTELMDKFQMSSSPTSKAQQT